MQITFFNHSDMVQKLYAADGTCVFLQPLSETTVGPAYVSQMPNPVTLECVSHTKADLIRLGVIKIAPDAPLVTEAPLPEKAEKSTDATPTRDLESKPNLSKKG